MSGRDRSRSRERGVQIYISGFGRRTLSEDLREAFKSFGRIRDVSMKRGFAFIEYGERSEAESAVDSMNGKELDGSKLTVEMAGKEKRRTKGPQQEDECWHCGKSGHWRNECPRMSGRYGSRKRSYSSSSSDSSSSSSSSSSRSRSRDHHKKKHRKKSASSSSKDKKRKRSSKKDKKKKHKASKKKQSESSSSSSSSSSSE